MSKPIQLQPGETEEQAIRRRVKMHEFLMTGGVALGEDQFGHMQYSAPITQTDLATLPECPFHHEADCIAWVEILAGRGSGEPVSVTLKSIRERTPEDREKIKQERLLRRADERVLAHHDQPNKMAWFDNPTSVNPEAGRKYGKKTDARDTAVAELGFGAVPDEITFEGDEEEEDE